MDKLVERTNGAITKQSISRYEKGIMRPKRDALFADAAQELAMSALLKGLRFSKYSILYDVVDSEFSLEVAVEDHVQEK